MAQATQEQKRADKPTNRPVHTIRYATVHAAIWRNLLDNGNASRPIYNATFSRSYKDGENNWKESSSFRLDDLLILAKVADETHTWISHQRPSAIKAARVNTDDGAAG
jgi:hypothetical protein